MLLLDDLTAIDRDLQVQSIAHGVLLLEQLNPEYRSERRRLRVVKYRVVQFRGGYHDYVIKRGGMEVFPRLVAAEHRQKTTRAKLSSEIKELDALLGGGIEEGTSTLIVGARGQASQPSRHSLLRLPQGAVSTWRCSCSTRVRKHCCRAATA